MVAEITEAKVIAGHRLMLRFNDGAEGEVDLAGVLSFHGVLAPLADPGYFSRVRVDPEAGTIVWPNGSDLDPDVLYSLATNEPIDTMGRRTEAGAGTSR